LYLTASVLSGFAVALVAPWVHRAAPRAAGSLLALFPLALTVYYAAAAPAVLSDGPLAVQHPWIPQLGISLAFRLDGLALIFVLLVSGIGALVIAYAGEYLQGEPQAGRFHAFLLAFLASMLGLVLADDLIALFLFWELTSVSSYFLIGFHSERKEARAAALQALLVTGGGGLALLAGFLLLGAAGGSMQLSVLAERGEVVRGHVLYLPVVLLVLAGAFTKSAQFPFHFWLPSAMQAPTPASAYLHAATMVKAGVYLLARTNPILSGSDVWQGALVAAGATTMALGAWRAVVERDLKAILAYSTIGALGALVLMIGLGTAAAVGAALAFLLAHALYKGALFLVAGIVDHETGVRDVDGVGGLRRAMPLTALAAALAALSMAGLPPVLGFVSKELLYAAAFAAERWAALASVAAALGGISLVAVALLVGVRPFHGARPATPKHPHEPSPLLWGAPFVLAMGGLVLGLWGAPASSLISVAAAAVVPGAPPLELSLWHAPGWPLALSAVGLVLGILAYRGRARLLAIDAFVGGGARWGPARGYDLALSAMLETARRQTRLLQSGSLRLYLLTILAATLAGVAYTLLVRRGWPGLPGERAWRFYEVALALLVAASAVIAVRSRSRFGSIAAMGMAGYGIALIFLLFGAPDLAMTQFVVETLTVILFVLAFRHLPPYLALSTPPARAVDLAVCTAMGVLMAALVLASAAVELGEKISPFYAESSVPLAHGRNIVNVILVDFRALDTLGEITVLAIAGFGVLALLKLRHGRGERP
jgi:multicomponent Na+:H+ antiporter subunit A